MTNCNSNCQETVAVVYRDNTGFTSTSGATTNDLAFNSATGILTSTVNGVSDTQLLTAAITGVQTPIAVVDSTTIDLTTSGVDNHTLTAAAKISTTSGNALTSNATGLFVAPTTNTLSFNSTTNTITTNVDGITASQVLPIASVQTPIAVVDSTTIDLTSSGTDNHTLTAAAKISTTAGNAITVNATGLFVSPASAGVQTPITVVDSTTIDLTSSGTDNHTLTAVAKISTVTGNLITSDANGLVVIAPATTNILAFNSATSTLTSTVDGIVATQVLPTTGGGTAETPLVATDSTTLDFTTSGTNGHNLTGVVRVSTTIGNSLTSNATGLFVTPTTNALSFNSATSTLTSTVDGIIATQVLPTGGGTAETALVVTDTSTIDFTTSGTNGHNLTGAVKLSATAGNIIISNADGIFAQAGAITTGNLLSDNTASVLTGASRLVGGNATVSVPLKIGTTGTAVTAPTTAGGYQLQSTDGSIIIANPTAGVINFTAPLTAFYLADTAATGTVTATTRTNSAFSHYTVPFTANRIHVLSTVGAVNGDNMNVSVGYAGADILPGTITLEIRGGTAAGTLIETFTDGLGIEGHYKFNGTAWVKVR